MAEGELVVLAQEAPRGEQDEMKETIVREWRGMTSLGVAQVTSKEIPPTL